ncbi:MAG: hypothetical protein KAI40_05850 [Desulfobacterales bacterium]|nr:hypothetical protein [Desulfobacterales bacterium]
MSDIAKVYNNSFAKPVIILEKTRANEIKIYPQPKPSKWNKKAMENLKAKIIQRTKGLTIDQKKVLKQGRGLGR